MYLERLRMDGKNAIVVGGGGRGMGTTTTMALADAGARLAVLELTAELANEVTEKVNAAGGECVGIQCDVTDRSQLKVAIGEAIEQLGLVHCLVNVAGGNNVGSWNPILEYPDDTYDAVMALNADYVFGACREVARHMVEQGIQGSMVNYSSSSGVAGAPIHSPYGAAKAAVSALTCSMAVEWGPHGIRVNAVAPGSVRTFRARASRDGEGEVLDRAGADEHAKTWAPLGRRLEADEVSAAVLFLTSDLASGITGQTILVDAGLTARAPSGGLEYFVDRR
jgi:NAD(P)-dependent dehydrogenase (short-subunit alcohol dehydrogenase family)